MDDERSTIAAVPNSAADGGEDNVLHFPRALMTREEMRASMDALTDLVRGIASGVERTEARLDARADERVARVEADLGEFDEVMRAELASLRTDLALVASHVDLLHHPNPAVRTTAAEVTRGDRDALHDLATKLEQQPGWWERNRSWALPTILCVGVVLSAAAVGVVVHRRMLREIESQRRRAQYEHAQRSRLESRVRSHEAEYLALYGRYQELEHALAGEQRRPLYQPQFFDHRATFNYDQRTTEQHEHRHVREHHVHQHVREHHVHQHEHHPVERTQIDVAALGSAIAERLPQPPSASAVASSVAAQLNDARPQSVALDANRLARDVASRISFPPPPDARSLAAQIAANLPSPSAVIDPVALARELAPRLHARPRSPRPSRIAEAALAELEGKR